MKIVVDFEATCCQNGEFPREQMEIIEIGACAVSDQHEIAAEFEAFIRPVRNPVLTEFCRSLTTITQSQVDAAETFPDVLASFQSWIDGFESPLFCSWGNYDRRQLLQDCQYHKVPYPFSDEHLNVKEQFSASLGLKKRFGLGQAVRRAGLTFLGTPHRGIDDARNIARLLALLKK